MGTCRSCGTPLERTSRFCSSCGAPVGDSSALPTGTAPRIRSPGSASPPGGRQNRSDSGKALGLSSTAVGEEGRFAAGALLIERYRVIGLLGKGGMGEVYRADDLKLGQAVALKFLPEQVAGDPDRLGRFYNEVRIAREISHPSVCRVHDIGDVEGQPFLSMEYVDGETLSSLLRRIGRLPADKAVEIARQVCAGLAAAHDKGVLHRDLKPDNVMIDGRGRARITDFGLAGLADDIRGSEVRSGTPAYMSPEQLAGKEVTFRSDVYSLGLVLYELFTGRRVFEGRSLAELARRHLDEEPTRPSELVSDLDPAIERVILRCLEKDPRQRPASALAVAAALPGGDPLAAALAAGETPSPELVAAAGEQGGLRPSVALAALATSLVGMLLAVALGRTSQLPTFAPYEKSPAVLEDRSRELLERLAVAEAPVDSASGLGADVDYLQHVKATDSSPGRWRGLARGQPPAVRFWYRESPRPLVASDVWGHVSETDPPLRLSGMRGVTLDMRGRLLELYVVPPQREPASASASATDWVPLFAAAGLDITQFAPSASEWTPPFYCDERAAWEGSFPDAPEIPIRIEAAAYRGRPVYFRIIAGWTRPERMQRSQLSEQQTAANRIGAVLLVSILLGAALLARHNLRLGRGDRKGAFRLAAYTLTASMLMWLLSAHHVASFGGELTLLTRALGAALLVAGLFWMLYVALEPYVRRRWPDALISWNRLLGGGLRDPLVGRHVLVGSVAGVVFAVLVYLGYWLPARLGLPPPIPDWERHEIFLGVRQVAALVIGQQLDAVAISLGLLLLLVLLRVVVRREWLAAVVTVGLLAVQLALGSELGLWLALPLFTLAWAIPVFVLLRFGLLALGSAVFTLALLVNYPLTLDFAHWTGFGSLFILLVAAATAAWGFHVSLAGQPLLKDDLLQG